MFLVVKDDLIPLKAAGMHKTGASKRLIPVAEFGTTPLKRIIDQ